MTDSIFPIADQAALDAVIKDRLERERTSITKKFDGYLSKDEVSNTIAEYKKQIEEINALHAKDSETIKTLTAQVKSYETANIKSKVAMELGLPFGMASRISGETEEDIRKDAQSLRDLMGATKPQAPQAATEPRLTQNPEKAIEDAAYRKLLGSISKD